MEIIDAQIHKPATWLEWSHDSSEADSRLATEISLAYMDAAGVDRAVMSANAAEMEWAESARSQFPDRLAITPSNVFDPTTPGVEEQMTELFSKPYVLAYRHALNIPADAPDKLKAGVFDPIFATCQKVGLPLMVLSLGQAELANYVVERFPDLQVIVDHLGLPQPPLGQVADDPPFKNFPQVLELAKHENVAVKFSAAPTLSLEPYPFNDLWPHVSKLVDAFGIDRLMWGTDIMRVTGRIAGKAMDVDFPGLHSYAEAVGFVRDTDHLSQSDKEQIFAGTLRKILGWPT